MPAKDTRRYIIMRNEGFLSDSLTAHELAPSANTINVMARAAAVAPAPKMQVLVRCTKMDLSSSKCRRRQSSACASASPWAENRARSILSPAVEAVQNPCAPDDRCPKPPRKMKVAKAAAAPSSVTVTVTDASGGAPIKGAQIVAFTDFAARQGASGTTDANGSATLLGLSSNRKLERVYVYAPAGFWCFYSENITASNVSQIKLAKIDVRAASLLLNQLYGSLPANAGAGVTVGVIDSGVDGKHPDLTNVTGGLNCVSDEVRGNPAAAQNWRPAKKEGEHGTHVAGIVGGRGTESGFPGCRARRDTASLSCISG